MSLEEIKRWKIRKIAHNKKHLTSVSMSLSLSLTRTHTVSFSLVYTHTHSSTISHTLPHHPYLSYAHSTNLLPTQSTTLSHTLPYPHSLSFFLPFRDSLLHFPLPIMLSWGVNEQVVAVPIEIKNIDIITGLKK